METRRIAPILSTAPCAIQYNCLAPQRREAGSQPCTIDSLLQQLLFVPTYRRASDYRPSRHACDYAYMYVDRGLVIQTK
jgi:hypothetical protein